MVEMTDMNPDMLEDKVLYLCQLSTGMFFVGTYIKELNAFVCHRILNGCIDAYVRVSEIKEFARI